MHDRERFFEIFAIEEGKEMRFDERIETTKVCIVLLSHVCIFAVNRNFVARTVSRVRVTKWNKESEGKIKLRNSKVVLADVVKQKIRIILLENARILKLPRITGTNNWSGSLDGQSRLIKAPFRYSESLFRLFALLFFPPLLGSVPWNKSSGRPSVFIFGMSNSIMNHKLFPLLSRKILKYLIKLSKKETMKWFRNNANTSSIRHRTQLIITANVMAIRRGGRAKSRGPWTSIHRLFLATQMAWTCRK